MSSLDLFSTSQRKSNPKRKKSRDKDKRIYDQCSNNAPYFAYHINGKKWGVVQGCCNDWNCPRCGQQRAREEYGRIVSGAREIAKEHPLYFLTITCRGRELSLEDAEHSYQEWSNRLLTRLRAEAKYHNKFWTYASVTERQDRGHPHTHFLTTYCPDDGSPLAKGSQKFFFTTGESFEAKHETIQSERLERSCTECGLGNQYDFSRVKSVEAGSRYISKYLFKASVFDTIWPKGWRRVRYAQNWPKLPEIKTDAFILMDAFDWMKLSKMALVIMTQDDGVKDIVRRKMHLADVIIQ